MSKKAFNHKKLITKLETMIKRYINNIEKEIKTVNFHLNTTTQYFCSEILISFVIQANTRDIKLNYCIVQKIEI